MLVLQTASLRVILLLAYQSFGVIYGDLSTSPLYVYRSTFAGKLRMHENDDEILGVLSFIFYTLTIIPVIKYVFIVLTADDNGEGECLYVSQNLRLAGSFVMCSGSWFLSIVLASGFMLALRLCFSLAWFNLKERVSRGYFYCRGTGGTFALYSLLCRHAKLSLLPNQQAADEELSTYKLEVPQESNREIWVKKMLEEHQALRTGLLIVVLLGTFQVYDS